MDLRCLRVAKIAYFSLSTHTKQLILVTFYDTNAVNGSGTEQDGTPMDKWTPQGQTDVKVEIVMYIGKLLSFYAFLINW